MNVRCPTCETIYRVDPAKVPAAGIRARCGVCAGIIPVSANGTAPVSPRAPAAAQTAAPPPTPVPAPPPPAVAAPPKAPTPTRRVTAPFIAPRRTEGAPTPTPVAPPTPRAAPSAPRPSAPVFTPTPGAPVTKPPVAAPVAAAPPRAAPPAPPAPPAAPPKPAGGFVNPFLAQDPRQKALRLARALVSDMIVYQPEKRQEALAAGNIKAAFEEEIKKSWEEYVDQIGEEIAGSTPYWTEALNEILAGGQQLF